MVDGNAPKVRDKKEVEERDGTAAAKASAIDIVWDWFSSKKLGLFLLLLVAVASIAGTVIPQGRPLNEYPASLVGIYQALGLTDMYRAWWFLLLLFLLTMNLFICSLNRFAPLLNLYSKPKIKVNGDFIRNQKLHVSGLLKGNMQHVSGQVENALKGSGYRVLREVEEERTFLYGDKGRIGIWGAYITHLAFLVIIIGALIGMYLASEGRVSAPVGKSFSLAQIREMKNPDLSFEIRVDDFETVYRPDGSVEQWYSALAVVENGQEVLSKRISVNDPLNYKGYKIYQSYYGSNIGVTVATRPTEKPRQFTVEERETFFIPGTDISIVPYKYVPDFDPAMGIQSKSNQPKNPRLVYLVYKGNQQIGVGAAKFGVAEVVGNNEAQVVFGNYAPYTGLQIRKDPGVEIVWLGCGLLMVGLILSFYVPHRRIWSSVEDKGTSSTLVVGGVTPKNKISFEKEFVKIAEGLNLPVKR